MVRKFLHNFSSHPREERAAKIFPGANKLEGVCCPEVPVLLPKNLLRKIYVVNSSQRANHFDADGILSTVIAGIS